MNIRYLFLSAALGLSVSACGDQSIRVAEGGIVGTGISVGPITGFGSIYANGVKFDTNSAVFVRDGIVVRGQEDFNQGEYVELQGDVNSDRITGVARKVIFDNILEGNVTVPASDENNIEIMGQKIKAGPLTLFNGFSTLSELNKADVIEVSGARDNSGVIHAFSLSMKSPSMARLDIEGKIEAINTTNQMLRIGGLTIDYSNAMVINGLAIEDVVKIDQYVEIRSDYALSQGRLLASTIDTPDENPPLNPGDYNELTGVVTGTGSELAINGIPVATNDGSLPTDGTASKIVVGSLLEVEGNVDASGNLVAENLKVRQPSAEDIVVLTNIATSDLDADARIISSQGELINVDSATLFVGSPAKRESVNSADDVAALSGGETLTIQAMRLDDGELQALRVDVVIAEPEDLIDPQAEATEPEVVEPEVVEPEVVEPEVVEPEVVEPEVVEPEVVEPEVVEPEVVEPEVVEPEVIEPEVIEPEVIEPEVIEPEVIEPEVIEPEVIEPEVVEPEVVEPEVVEPEVVEPEVVEPEVVEPEVVEPEVVEPEVVEPEVVEPEVVEPEVVEPEVIEPEVVEPEVVEPEVVEPEVIEPEVIEPEVIEPEVVEPEVVEPEVVEPEVVEPEVVEPEVIEPEVIEPEVIEPEVVEPESAIEGILQEVNMREGTLLLEDSRTIITITDRTTFSDVNGITISQKDFYSMLEEGAVLLRVSGYLSDDNLLTTIHINIISMSNAPEGQSMVIPERFHDAGSPESNELPRQVKMISLIRKTEL